MFDQCRVHLAPLHHEQSLLPGCGYDGTEYDCRCCCWTYRSNENCWEGRRTRQITAIQTIEQAHAPGQRASYLDVLAGPDLILEVALEGILLGHLPPNLDTIPAQGTQGSACAEHGPLLPA